MKYEAEVIGVNEHFKVLKGVKSQCSLEWLGDQVYHLTFQGVKYLAEIKKFIFTPSGIEIECWAGDIDTNKFGRLGLKLYPQTATK